MHVSEAGGRLIRRCYWRRRPPGTRQYIGNHCRSLKIDRNHLKSCKMQGRPGAGSHMTPHGPMLELGYERGIGACRITVAVVREGAGMSRTDAGVWWGHVTKGIHMHIWHPAKTTNRNSMVFKPDFQLKGTSKETPESPKKRT